MDRLRSFSIKLLPATNTKGTRIKIIDTFFQGRTKDKTTAVILSYNYKYNHLLDQALDHLKKVCDINIVSYSYNTKDNAYILLTKDFETELKREV
tara:strand:+ start:41 stop:325 length:285 start_codon:yes stop_codon:yes gene_type:complete